MGNSESRVMTLNLKTLFCLPSGSDQSGNIVSGRTGNQRLESIQSNNPRPVQGVRHAFQKSPSLGSVLKMPPFSMVINETGLNHHIIKKTPIEQRLLLQISYSLAIFNPFFIVTGVGDRTGIIKWRSHMQGNSVHGRNSQVDSSPSRMREGRSLFRLGGATNSSVILTILSASISGYAFSRALLQAVKRAV